MTAFTRLSLALVLTIALAIPSFIILGGGLTPNGTQPPLAIPIEGPNQCQGCHGGFDNGHNIRPWTTWSGSMMGNAGRDPIFWAALDVANNDLPGVGDFCIRCHAPSAWLAGRSEPPGGSTDGCGLVGNIDDANNDFQGLSCSVCHRMYVNPSPPGGQDPVYFENGSFWIDDVLCPDGSSEPCRRGPYDYLGGEEVPPHDWIYSDYHVESDICGNCHNVTNPVKTLIDETGTDTGIPMPVERTFKEWQMSEYAPGGSDPTTCQNCHLPDATDDPASPCIFQTNNRTGDLPIHQLVGGNSWIPQVLKNEYPNLGRADAYDATTAWSEQMLASAASMALTTSEVITTAQDVDFTVRVTNLSGHKLPTGYPEGRRMWIAATLKDATNTVLWESGIWNSTTGELPPDAQLKVYETNPGIWNFKGNNTCDTVDGSGDALFHFVLNDCIAKDNRIPPLGFSGGTNLEVRPVDYFYPETSPGSGILVNYDDTVYSITMGGAVTAPLTLETTLFYQTISKDYVDFLENEAIDNAFPDDCIPRTGGTPTESRGEILKGMWNDYGKSAPVVMASATTMVHLEVFTDGFESGDTSAWSAVNP